MTLSYMHRSLMESPYETRPAPLALTASRGTSYQLDSPPKMFPQRPWPGDAHRAHAVHTPKFRFGNMLDGQGGVTLPLVRSPTQMPQGHRRRSKPPHLHARRAHHG